MGVVQVQRPDDLKQVIDRQVAEGHAASEADFLTQAARRHADHLDAENEISVMVPPWARLGARLADAVPARTLEGNIMRLIRRRATAALAAVLCLMALPLAGASAQSALSGVYKVNGKPAALTQVTASKGAPESGKPVTVLVFTTKDQAKDPKAGFNALFGKFGDALVVKILPDGKVLSADLMHSSLKSPSGSMTVFDVLEMKDFTIAGSEISGHLTSGGPHDVQGQNWEVDLTFHTKAP